MADKTPTRSVRVPDAVWDLAAARAAAENRTITAVITTSLREYGVGRWDAVSPPVRPNRPRSRS